MEWMCNEMGISDRVHFLGLVPWQKIFEYLNVAGVFVSAASLSNLSNTLLEAMACEHVYNSVSLSCPENDLLFENLIIIPQDIETLA